MVEISIPNSKKRSSNEKNFVSFIIISIFITHFYV